jgi:hypothetical protein
LSSATVALHNASTFSTGTLSETGIATGWPNRASDNNATFILVPRNCRSGTSRVDLAQGPSGERRRPASGRGDFIRAGEGGMRLGQVRTYFRPPGDMPLGVPGRPLPDARSWATSAKKRFGRHFQAVATRDGRKSQSVYIGRERPGPIGPRRLDLQVNPWSLPPGPGLCRSGICRLEIYRRATYQLARSGQPAADEEGPQQTPFPPKPKTQC